MDVINHEAPASPSSVGAGVGDTPAVLVMKPISPSGSVLLWDRDKMNVCSLLRALPWRKSVGGENGEGEAHPKFNGSLITF